MGGVLVSGAGERKADIAAAVPPGQRLERDVRACQAKGAADDPLPFARGTGSGERMLQSWGCFGLLESFEVSDGGTEQTCYQGEDYGLGPWMNVEGRAYTQPNKIAKRKHIQDGNKNQ